MISGGGTNAGPLVPDGRPGKASMLLAKGQDLKNILNVVVFQVRAVLRDSTKRSQVVRRVFYAIRRPDNKRRYQYMDCCTKIAAVLLFKCVCVVSALDQKWYIAQINISDVNIRA